MPSVVPPLLTLYSRHGCHLCDDMLDGLRVWQARFSFRLEIVDVDVDPVLVQRFGVLVPVLMAGETELCHYFLDRHVLDAYFGEIG